MDVELHYYFINPIKWDCNTPKVRPDPFYCEKYGVSSSRLMQLANFLKVPITYFYEDFPGYKADSELDSSTTDLNYSFLVKTFSKLSESEKTKVLQILRNAGNLKETG